MFTFMAGRDGKSVVDDYLVVTLRKKPMTLSTLHFEKCTWAPENICWHDAPGHLPTLYISYVLMSSLELSLFGQYFP